MYCSPCSLTIPVFGIDGAGKSSLIYRLKGDISKPPPTGWGFSTTQITTCVQLQPSTKQPACLGFINPIPFCCTKKKTIRMNLYDLGGLESIRAIWKNYLAEAHGYVYVIDGLDLTRLGESVQALKDIYSFPKMQGKPLLILITNQHSTDCITLEKLHNHLQMAGIPIDNDLVSIRACSLYTPGTTPDQLWTDKPNVDKSIEWLCVAIFSNIRSINARIKTDMQIQQQEWAQYKLEKKVQLESRAALELPPTLIENSDKHDSVCKTQESLFESKKSSIHRSDGKVHPIQCCV